MMARSCLWLLALTLALAGPAAAVSLDDRYLAGYAAAVLDREFQRPAASLRVEDGIITLDAADLGTVERARVRDALAGIPGVAGVRVLEGEEAAGARVATAGAETTAPTRGARREAAVRQTGFLPPGELFRPLLADPRWPRFAAVYRYYFNDRELGNVGAANFGATVPLYRGNPAPLADVQWEAGLQAGVFSIFDLDADSKDLINADYFVSLLGSYRAGDAAGILRIFHQSSHLGDEFLLRNRVNRVNLSYEGVDVKLSYDLFDALRLYGGGGYLFDREPASLDPGLVQYGIEVTSPWSFAGGAATPIAAADFQNTEESNWRTQYSVLTGLQLERVRIADSALLLGLEWFRGQSPNGQFYGRKVEWFGVGAHLYF